jgi:predicted dehydrogenase
LRLGVRKIDEVPQFQKRKERIVTEQTNAPLRHVAIGVGAGIFSMHRRALELETAQLVAAADINPALQETVEAELNVPFYTDHRQMLADTQPDVAIVVTPHPFHAPLAIDALRAGCHVLVEKPIAVQVGEADEMVRAARAADRLLAVNFQQRLRPEVRAIHQVVQSGQLGEIQHVRMVATWTRTRAYFAHAGWRGTWRGEGGGVLMNQSPHNLDMLCYLMDLPARVAAWTRTRLHTIETEDTAHAMLEWPNGALGSIHVSTAEAGTPFLLELTGTGGVLRWDRAGIDLQRFQPNVRIHILEDPGLYSAPEVLPAVVELTEGEGDHVAVYRNFHDAILHGAPLSCDGAEASKSLELANAMIYSSHTGQMVELPLDRAEYAALLAELCR